MTTPIRSQDYALALGGGTRLVQYEIERVLGQGSFGITYLASEPLLGDLGEKVAIKEFLPCDLAGRATDHDTVVPHTPERRDLFQHGLEKFLEEARRLKLLSKGSPPNIVRVRTAFEANGTAYLVMDYYEGETLTAYIRRDAPDTGPYATRKLEAEDAVSIMAQVLRGLAAVHGKGFVHRDVKPDNVYLRVREDGTRDALLLDFGAARQALLEQKRTADWTVVLSRGYAPPEQYQRSGEQGPWTDIYACAAVLYQLVTGEVPPDGDLRQRSAEGMLKDDDAELVPVLQLAPDCPPDVAAAIEQGLALEPRERPQTADEFVELLEGRADAGAEEAPPAPASPTVVVEHGATVVLGDEEDAGARRSGSPSTDPGARESRDPARPARGTGEELLEHQSGMLERAEREGTVHAPVRPTAGSSTGGASPAWQRPAAAAAIVLLAGAIGGAVYFAPWSSTPADGAESAQETVADGQAEPPPISSDVSEDGATDPPPVLTPQEESGSGGDERLAAGPAIPTPTREQPDRGAGDADDGAGAAVAPQQQRQAMARTPTPTPTELQPVRERLFLGDVHLGGGRFLQAEAQVDTGLTVVGRLLRQYPRADTLMALRRALQDLREENRLNCKVLLDAGVRNSCPGGG